MGQVVTRFGLSYPNATRVPFGDQMRNSSGVKLNYGSLVMIDGVQPGEDTSTYDEISSYIFTVTVPTIPVGFEYQAFAGMYRVVTEPNGIEIGESGMCAGRFSCIADLLVKHSTTSIAAMVPVVIEDASFSGAAAFTPDVANNSGRKVCALVLTDQTVVAATATLMPCLFNGEHGFGTAGDKDT